MTRKNVSSSDQLWTREKLVAAVTSAAYVVGAHALRDGEHAAELLILGIVANLCIWFPELIAQYSSYHPFPVARGIVRTTPATVRVSGWIFLLLPAILGIILYPHLLYAR